MEKQPIISVVEQWKVSQQDQTSAYDYEQSFDQMWQQLGKDIFQDSFGQLPIDKNKKNYNDQIRQTNCSKKSHFLPFALWFSDESIFTGISCFHWSKPCF